MDTDCKLMIRNWLFFGSLIHLFALSSRQPPPPRPRGRLATARPDITHPVSLQWTQTANWLSGTDYSSDRWSICLPSLQTDGQTDRFDHYYYSPCRVIGGRGGVPSRNHNYYSPCRVTMDTDCKLMIRNWLFFGSLIHLFALFKVESKSELSLLGGKSLKPEKKHRHN